MFSAVAQTSCDSFSFDYQWTIKKLKTLVVSGAVDKTYSSRLGPSPCAKTYINSQNFCPGFYLGGSNATFTLNFQAWYLKYDFVPHACPNEATEPTSSQCSCVRLQVTLNYSPAHRCFAEGSLSLKKSVSLEKLDSALSEQLQEVGSTRFEPEWIESGKKMVSVEISETELKAGLSKYTQNDSLTVYCEMTVHEVNNLKHKIDTLASVPLLELKKCLNVNRKDNIYTDVTIVCGERKFEVHRVVIGSQSAFFKAKLQRWETGEKTIDMSDLDPEIIEVMINYMYTGKMSRISEQTYPDLLAACEKYQLSALKSICENSLIKNVTESNALSLLKLASTHNADHLKQKAIDVIKTKPMTQMVKELVW